MAARAANAFGAQGSWHLAIRNPSLSRYGAGLEWRPRKKPSRRHDDWMVVHERSGAATRSPACGMDVEELRRQGRSGNASDLGDGQADRLANRGRLDHP